MATLAAPSPLIQSRLGQTTRLRSNRLAFLLLCSVVALAPLPFGSTDGATIAFWAIVLGIGTVSVSTRTLRRAHVAMLCGIAVIVVLYGFVLHEQLSDTPWLAAPHPYGAKQARFSGWNSPLRSQ